MQGQVIDQPASRRHLLFDQSRRFQRRGAARNMLPALSGDFRQAAATGPALPVRAGMKRQGQVGANFGTVAIVKVGNFAEGDGGEGN